MVAVGVWGPGELSQSTEFTWRTGHHSLSPIPSDLGAATDISGKEMTTKEGKAWITGGIWKSWTADLSQKAKVLSFQNRLGKVIKGSRPKQQIWFLQ